jgi:hypothetical protein
LTLTSHKVHPTKTLQDIYFEIETISCTFDPEAFLNASTTCQNLSDVVSVGDNHMTVEVTPNSTKKFDSSRAFSANGILSSFSIIVTDKLIPFVRLRSSELSLSHSSSQKESCTSLFASSIIFQCVAPTSENYPDIITTYQSDREDDYFEHHALAIQITKQAGDAAEKNDLSIRLDGVRILLLRQCVNEIMQYLSSPDYGLGLLRSLNERRQLDEHPPSLQQLTVQVTDSSVVLPRDSNSIDLVGIEVDELSISPLRVSESWSVDYYSFSGETGSPSKIAMLNQESTRSSSSEIFFDCTDDPPMPMASAPKNIAHNPTSSRDVEALLSRLELQIKGARIFTALNAIHHSSDPINLALWNHFILSTGRAENKKEAFTQRLNAHNHFASEIQARVWEEVTSEPLSISIKADWAPLLRLLIEDSSNVALDMRMSQFYLIISIWYSNMMQLPLLFPYDSKMVEDASIPPDPPCNWPEYGTDEFVTRLTDCFNESTFEFALCFTKLSLRCSYDMAGYFTKDPPLLAMIGSDTISVSLGCAICNILSDKNDVLRVGIGAASIKISDERKNNQDASAAINGVQSFVDMNWGLKCGRQILFDGLPLPFQVNVVMSPDNHCMINLGAGKFVECL